MYLITLSRTVTSQWNTGAFGNQIYRSKGYLKYAHQCVCMCVWVCLCVHGVHNKEGLGAEDVGGVSWVCAYIIATSLFVIDVVRGCVRVLVYSISECVAVAMCTYCSNFT